MRGYHRMRPKVSFALATGFLFVLAAILTGIMPVSLDLSVIDSNPQLIFVALLFASIAALLLYEW